jgi:hypothetical protein
MIVERMVKTMMMRLILKKILMHKKSQNLARIILNEKWNHYQEITLVWLMINETFYDDYLLVS